MAVYNGERYLKPTIESTLNQTFKNFEFVIVNDASVDKTKEIIRSYNDPRIKLYNNEKNIGQTKSLNVGLNIAKGKYIARIDAGDVSMPKRLEKQLAFMEKNKEIIVLGTSAFRYDESGRIIDIVHMPTLPSIILQRIFYASPLVHISVLMNKKTILEIGGYNDDFHVLADYELWSRLLQKGYKIWNLREVLSGYMVSADSFGAIHSLNKSIVEGGKIIQSNIDKFADISISNDDAINIYRLLALKMNGLTLLQVLDCERLIRKIFNRVGISKKNSNFVITTIYIKHVIQHSHKNNEYSLFRYSVKRSILNGFLLPLYKRFYDEVLIGIIHGFIWRNIKNSYGLDFEK